MDYYIILCILVASAVDTSSDCPNACKCEGPKLSCFETIPENIPLHITEVVIYETQCAKTFKFTGLGWQNVTSLSINPELSVYNSESGDKLVFRPLYGYELEGLRNLEKIQIACRCLTNVASDAFSGLHKLKILDMSNNERLSVYAILNALNNADLSTKLSEIYISNSSNSAGQPLLQVDILRFTRNIKLKILDISKTPVWFKYDNELFTSFPDLEKLNISESFGSFATVTWMFIDLNMNYVTSFNKLKILDISYPDITFEIREIFAGSGFVHDIQIYLPSNLTELYAKRLVAKPILVNSIISNVTHACVSFEQNNVSNNLCFVGQFKNLKKLVFSENSLTYMDSNMFDSYPNLQYLDGSLNNLGNVISEGYLQSVINKLPFLDTLILSNNKIKNIPYNTFSTPNALRILDLSHNQIETVGFDTTGLTSISTLDLSYNNIAFLDNNSIYKVSYLPFSNETKTKRGKAEVSLKGNPFVCSCGNLQSLNWLTEHNESLYCLLDSEKHFIDYFAIRKTIYLCKRNFVLTVFALLSFVVTLLLVLMVYLLILEYRSMVRKKLISQGKEIFSVHNKFPVFLSFCSEDDEIVMEEILPNLEKGLRKILNTESQCVATGYSEFRPGFPLADEISRCVTASFVVIFFVTNAFCRKMWCRNETLVAHYENKEIILMIWEHIDTSIMPKYLQKHYLNHVRVHWIEQDGARVMKPCWDILCEAIVSKFAGKETQIINDLT